MRAAKAALAVVGGLVTVAIEILSDDAISAAEIGVFVTAVLTAFGVYSVPNRPS